MSLDAGKQRSLLQAACSSGDAREAARALLAWARAEQPKRAPAGLAALSQAVEGADLQTAITELDRHLYSEHVGDWSGQALWKQLQSGIPWMVDSTQLNPERSPLPELYPVSR